MAIAPAQRDAQIRKMVGDAVLIVFSKMEELNKEPREELKEEPKEEQRINVMQIYQIIRIFSNACEKRNLNQIRKLHRSDKILQKIKIMGTVTEDVLSQPEKRMAFRYNVIEFMLDYICNKYQDDDAELLFAASAKFDMEQLEEVTKELKKDPNVALENINQTRYSDSAINFALKYGKISNPHFFNSVKILIDAGINVNKFDFKGQFPIDYIASLYEAYENKPEVLTTLKDVVRLFLDKIYKPENEKTLTFLTNVMEIDVNDYQFKPMDEETLLFYMMAKSDTAEFLKRQDIGKHVNKDDGENTLLQLACKKDDSMVSIVEHLLDNGADPNIRTKSNELTPLELAAKNNHQKIFEEILKNGKIKIQQQQYDNLVMFRSQRMKPKLFELFLESYKLDPTLTYKKTGNTPLHYAISFRYRTAIQILLKRESCLIVKNEFNVSPLDIIDAEDLEKYFDSCLALGNYNSDFNNPNYKMRFRFKCLIDYQKSREMKVVSKISNHPGVGHLLTHPFIHYFITLKWFRIKKYFKVILAIQALLFLLLSVLLYRFPYSTRIERGFCIFVTIVNLVLKALLLFCFKWKNKDSVLFFLRRGALHFSFEILLAATIILSLFIYQMRAFVFVEMAILLLLTAGYHPILSKWSVMLQQVFRSFVVLLLFFSLIIVSFSFGFHILFPNEAFFKKKISAILKSFIMTIGEFNIEEDTGLDESGFAGYLMFFVFAMSMSLVIVNFWTGVAVTDIERIEKSSEINAFRNVILFTLFIDYMFRRWPFSKLTKYSWIPNPQIFIQVNENVSDEINFYVNKEKQIEDIFFVPKGHKKKGSSPSKVDKDKKVAFPSRVDDECFNKIISHYYKLVRVSSEQEILAKLDEISNYQLARVSSERETLAKLDEISKLLAEKKISDATEV